MRAIAGTALIGLAGGVDRVGINTRFIGRSRFDVTDASPETRAPRHGPAYFYNDVTVRLRASDRIDLTLGVTNLGAAGIFGPLQNTAPNPNSSGGVQTGAAYHDPVGLPCSP